MNSALPPRDDRTMYSSDDVDHIVARKIAAQQILELQNGQLAINQKLLEIMAHFDNKLSKIYDRINDTPEDVQACKTELKNEIKTDHPSRSEMIILEGKLLTKLNDSVNLVDGEVKKFKHMAQAFIVAGGVVFILGQYIVVEAMNGLRASITDIKSYTVAEAKAANDRHIILEGRVNATYPEHQKK